jgi:large subunit ribosomal protein L20
MARVKGGVIRHKRQKKVLKNAKGYVGGRHRLFRTAKETTYRSLAYAFRDRRQRKRQFRRLWITRISAGCEMNGISYSRFIDGLSRAKVEVDRKQLADLAYHDLPAFAELVRLAKAQLANEVA